MKPQIIIATMVTLLSISMSHAQFVTIDVRNKDRDTRRKMGAINAAVATRIAGNLAANSFMRNTIRHYKQQLDRNYRRYSNDGLFTNEIKKLNTGVTAIAAEAVAANELPYMTNNKREYIRQMTLDKAVLLFLTRIDHRVIKNGDRLEIYRLRNRLIRQYSKNDKIARQLASLPAVAFAVENKTELLKLLQAIKIFL